MKTLTVLAFVMILPLLMTSQAHAFRCANGNLILEGDTSLEVAAHCGQPADKETVGLVKIKGRYVNVVRYLYIPSSGHFPRILEFHNGVVARIILGRRV